MPSFPLQKLLASKPYWTTRAHNSSQSHIEGLAGVPNMLPQHNIREQGTS